MLKACKFKPEQFESYIGDFDEVIKLTDFEKGGNLYYACEHHSEPHPYDDYDVDFFRYHIVSDLGASLGFYDTRENLHGETVCGGYENVSNIKNIRQLVGELSSQKKKLEAELNKTHGRRGKEKCQQMLNDAHRAYLEGIINQLARLIANGDGLSKYIPDGVYIEHPDFNKRVIKAKIESLEEKKTPKGQKQFLEEELKKIDENFERKYKQKGEDE